MESSCTRTRSLRFLIYPNCRQNSAGARSFEALAPANYTEWLKERSCTRSFKNRDMGFETGTTPQNRDIRLAYLLSVLVKFYRYRIFISQTNICVYCWCLVNKNKCTDCYETDIFYCRSIDMALYATRTAFYKSKIQNQKIILNSLNC